MGRKMKDSGVEWIGEIPEDWQINKLKYVADFEPSSREKESKLDEEDLITYTPMECIKNGKFDNRSIAYGKISTSLTRFQEGDICIAKVTPCFENGNIAIMENLHNGFGMGSSELFVIRPKEINKKYLFYWLMNQDFVQHGCATMTGTGGLKRVDSRYVKNTYLHYPSYSEQEKISRYLDEKCSEIDKNISDNYNSIECYKSLKQSLITRAVTKGVRGKREMKDSRVKRWGMIPNNWDFVRLKYCITNVSSGLSAVTDDDTSGESGKFVLRTSAVSTGIFIPSEVKAVLKSAEVRLKCPVEGNTLIVSRMNTSNMVGSCAYVDRDYENIFLPDKLWKIHLKKEYNVKFFWYAINSIPARAYYSEISTGASASMQNITMADFGNNKIALPPIDEQDCIASYLDEKCTAIDTLIAKKEQLLTELEAYKKSLIYEYVTGKREVLA